MKDTMLAALIKEFREDVSRLDQHLEVLRSGRVTFLVNRADQTQEAVRTMQAARDEIQGLVEQYEAEANGFGHKPSS